MISTPPSSRRTVAGRSAGRSPRPTPPPPSPRGRGYRWLAETSSALDPSWFINTYARVTGLPLHRYTHQGDRQVAAALSTMAPIGASITEFTVRNFRHTHSMKSYTKPSSNPQPAATPPTAEPAASAAQLSQLSNAINTLSSQMDRLLSSLYVQQVPVPPAP